jgi:hypothetical protein
MNDHAAQLDEMKARLAVVEVICLIALATGIGGSVAASLSPDDDARKTLDAVRGLINERCREMGEAGVSAPAIAAAKTRGDELLSYILGNLDLWSRDEKEIATERGRA